MLIQLKNNSYDFNFGLRFKLSEQTLNSISKSTKLSRDELYLPFGESEKLMKERGAIKEPSKIKMWLMTQYKKFGERLGLLEKEYNIYTDVD